MIEDIQKLLDGYTQWLREKTKLRDVGEWVEITTPYLDRHNDYLQIYAKKTDKGYMLTDDGYIIQDLQQSGCDLESNKRKNLLKITLNGFGVQQEDNEALTIHATEKDFSHKKHSLIQAMLAVNDLFYLATPLVASIFLEDVETWLNLHDVRYIAKPRFIGKSGYNHVFDFAIPKSKVYPERIIKAINNPSRQAAESFLFEWDDIKEVRPADSWAYALLNDSERSVSGDVIGALKNYEIRPILWSQREEARTELAA